VISKKKIYFKDMWKEGRNSFLGEYEKLLVGKNDAPCHAGLVKPKRLKFETLFLPILKVSTLASY
jgi:hypothetical protein